MLFALAGMMLMATASDLLVIFLALEVLSLAVYVLTGIRRDSPTATEAAFKYFLLGAFSSAFFLYGIAFTYGVTGSTRLDRIGSADGGAGDVADADAVAGDRPAARRLRVQGVGRAVSHVDAGRLRRRAAGGHRLHVDRREGRGVRGVRPRVSLGASSRCAASGAPSLWVDRGRDDDRRDGRRRGAVERQADARVLEHRARRLPAASRSSSANDVGKGAVLFYLLTYAVTNLGAFGVIALLETRRSARTTRCATTPGSGTSDPGWPR